MAKKGFGIIATLLAAPASWIAYSALGIDHNLPLELAVDAERRAFLSSEAGLLSYYVDRRKPGRPLVLLHSINAAASAYEMRPLFEHYRELRPVYALDLPGFGFSERSEREYSPRLYIQAVLDFLMSEVGQPADVIALSLGGEFAAHAALARPDLFRSLTMISPTGFTKREHQESVQWVSQKGLSQGLHGLFAFPLWSQAFYDLLATRSSIRYFLQMNFEDTVDKGLEDYAYATSHQPGARHAPLYFISGNLFTANIYEAVYKRLETPTLVIYDRDPNVRFDLLENILHEGEDWNAARIAPTLGLPQFEQLPHTTRAIDQFWARQDALEDATSSGWTAWDSR
ncbi:MAG: alpha/beta fold hydrolase [Anaerolineae bacterium]|nr:alpha/beta fold hydrolase [Anaerolineae bacterium]